MCIHDECNGLQSNAGPPWGVPRAGTFCDRASTHELLFCERIFWVALLVPDPTCVHQAFSPVQAKIFFRISREGWTLACFLRPVVQ